MGKYVNATSKRSLGASYDDKCEGILDDGGIEVPRPERVVENLVCVVNNGPFAAAAYCFDQRELDCFLLERDKRPKRWFVWDKVTQYID
jgi:hypothetical protein